MNTYFYNKELDEIRSKLSLSEIEKINETLQKYSFILNSNDSLENTKRMFSLYLARKRQMQKWGVSVLLLLFIFVSFFVLFYKLKSKTFIWIDALEFLLYASAICIFLLFVFFQFVKRCGSILNVEKLFKNHFVEFENFKKNFQLEINKINSIDKSLLPKTILIFDKVKDEIFLEKNEWNSHNKQEKVDNHIINYCKEITDINSNSGIVQSLNNIKTLLGISL